MSLEQSIKDFKTMRNRLRPINEFKALKPENVTIEKIIAACNALEVDYMSYIKYVF